MSILRPSKDYVDIWLEVLCHNDPTHELGVAILHLPPRPDAGTMTIGNGLTLDEYGKAVADCRECGVTGRGRDQRISTERLRGRLDELAAQQRHTGKIQV